MKYILTILLFISVQSFCQKGLEIKRMEYTISDSGHYKMTAGNKDSIFNIEFTIGKPDSVVSNDTIYATKIIRCQTNNNSSMLMTKVKYLLKRNINGEIVIYTDDGKLYDIVLYYLPRFKTWISL